MPSFKKFAQDYIYPEDPMDWIIAILLGIVTIVGGIFLVIMFSQGLI